MSKINQHANEMVHGIATVSFDNRTDGVLINSFPPYVSYDVMSDCNNIIN